MKALYIKFPLFSQNPQVLIDLITSFLVHLAAGYQLLKCQKRITQKCTCCVLVAIKSINILNSRNMESFGKK